MRTWNRLSMLGAPLLALVQACASSGGATDSAASGATGPVQMRRGIEGTRTVIQQGAIATTTIDVPLAPAWSALQAAYAELGLDVTERIPQRRLGSEGHRLVRLAGRRASYYVDCGTDLSGPIADDARVLLTVLSATQAHSGGGTDVAIRVNAEARYGATGEGIRDCTSTGKLEELILQKVLEHAKS